MSREERRQKSGSGKSNKSGKKDGLSIKFAVACIVAVVVLGIAVMPFIGRSDTDAEFKGSGLTETSSIDGVDTSIKKHRTGSELVNMNEDEAEEAKAEIKELLENIRKSNAYMQAYISDTDYDIYIFNADGEAVMQSADGSATTIYLNNGDAIRFTDYLSYGSDIDIVELCENAVDSVGYDWITFEKSEVTADNEEELGFDSNMLNTEGVFNNYVITVNGLTGIHELYISNGMEFADSMMSGILDVMDEGWEPVFKFRYITYRAGEDNSISVFCSLPENGVDYTNWYFDGYIPLSDWKLEEAWYTLTEDNADTAESLLDSLLQELSDELMKQSGVMYDEDEDSSGAAEEESGKSEALENEDGGASESEDEAVESSNEDVNDESIEDLENKVSEAGGYTGLNGQHRYTGADLENIISEAGGVYKVDFS